MYMNRYYVCKKLCDYSNLQLYANIFLKRVHLRQEERLNVRVGRDGGLQNFELHGLVTLHISDEKWGRIRVQIENRDTRGIQLQTHPNVDKELFRAHGQIGLKVPAKPFPLNTDVGVLKWRFQAQDETALPITSKIASKIFFYAFMIHL